MCKTENEIIDTIKTKLDDLTKKGLRVLAVACGEVSKKNNNEEYSLNDYLKHL